MANPIDQVIKGREQLDSKSFEKQAVKLVGGLEDTIKRTVTDEFSMRLMRRFEGGLDTDQKFQAIGQFNQMKGRREVRKALFNHREKRNGRMVQRQTFEHNMVAALMNAARECYVREQKLTVEAFNENSSLKVKFNGFTRSDKRQLRRMVIGGFTIKEYVKTILNETHNRLVARLRQTIIAENTVNLMILRMRKEVELVMVRLKTTVERFMFEVCTTAANQGQTNFIESLGRATA